MKNTTVSYVAYSFSACEFFPTKWYQSFMLWVLPGENKKEKEWEKNKEREWNSVSKKKCVLDCFVRKKRRDG